MVKNPFDGLYMTIDFEEKEWFGGYITKCSLCRKELIYPLLEEPSEDMEAPLILTHIDRASLDEHKHFCSYNCLEDWINEFVVKFI